MGEVVEERHCWKDLQTVRRQSREMKRKEKGEVYVCRQWGQNLNRRSERREAPSLVGSVVAFAS